MKMKRIISTFLITAFLGLALVGCTKNKNTGTNGNNVPTGSDVGKDEKTYQGVSGNTPVVNGVADTSKFVTVKMLVLGDPPAGGADKRVFEELNKILKEKLNAELEVSWIEWNNYDTKYQMELVTGTPYDLIFTTSTWLNLWDHAEKGAFMDLTEMIPYYAPSLWADTKQEEWDGVTYKGKVVALPEHRKWQLSTPVFAYRLDWANEFGIEKVDSMETLEQYFDGILANKPGVVPYNIGGSVNSNELYAMWLRQDTDYVLGPGSVGMSCPVVNASYEDNWTSVSPVFTNEFEQFAIKMKEWGDRGYWPEDVMSFTVDTEAAFLTGKSGIWSANVANYYSLFEKVSKENPDAKIDAFFFDEKRGFCIADVVTQDACSITANAQNPERALMMYDLFQYDSEIYHLTQYGIEGVQYEISDEGFRQRPESYQDEVDGYYWNMWSTRNDALEIPEKNIFQVEIDAINTKIKPWTRVNPWGSFVLDGSMIDAQIAAINEAGSSWLPAIQFGKAGDPKEAVAKYRKALQNAGIDDYMKEVERQMQEYLSN